MMRATRLYGRAVVALDGGERLGVIDELIVDPARPGIAGYVVACERAPSGHRERLIIPVDAIHATGPDAVTVRSIDRADEQAAHLDALPRLSELTGRRMVSLGRRYLGSVKDALVDERDGRIIGYPLERPGPRSWLDSLLGLSGYPDHPDYVRADASLGIGTRLIVVPDDAIVHAERPAMDTGPIAAGATATRPVARRLLRRPQAQRIR